MPSTDTRELDFQAAVETFAVALHNEREYEPRDWADLSEIERERYLVRARNLLSQSLTRSSAERGEGTDPVAWLAEENRRLKLAGDALSVAALRVTAEYDGVHRLRLAVADWSKVTADEGGRALAAPPAPTEGEEVVEAVVREIGMGHGAWDMVDPKELIAAVLRVARPAEGSAERDGVALIAAERKRQVDAEWWTAEHDDHHRNSEMAIAAAVYAYPPDRPVEIKRLWPWARDWWKPEASHISRVDATAEDWRSARIRVLVKAGALIAAEIDRLQRLAAPPGRGERSAR